MDEWCCGAQLLEYYLMRNSLQRLSRSSAAMGRAQCITATPRKRGLHSFKVLEDHRQPAASDRRTTKATFSSRHFRPRWRRL